MDPLSCVLADHCNVDFQYTTQYTMKGQLLAI